jgi:acetolactate synthase-1/2/3 large subunit
LGDSARPEPGLARAAAHAAQLLNGSRRIALYIGAGALAAQAELRELADRLDAIVFTTISGKGVFPERHERWAWATMGAAAPPPIRGLEADLDCLLAIGCRFSEVATASYGFAPPPTLVHVDIDPLALGRNYPPTLAIAADARDFARALLAEPSLSRRTPDGERLRGLARAQAAVSALQGCPAPAASEPATDASAASARAPSRVSPGALFSALQGAMGDAAVFVTDSGNGTFLAMERLRLSRPRSFLAPIDYSCMGYSIPAAIGAKLAAPDRPVIALPGDGAFLMTGLELATARQYGVGIIAFLLRDFELAQIAQFQRASLNRASCTSISNYSARAIAEATGAEYLALERDADLGATIRRAMGIASGGVPVLVETQIDYSQPSFFSKGAIKTNFLRFAWKDRLRLAGRVIGRKLLRPR